MLGKRTSNCLKPNDGHFEVLLNRILNVGWAFIGATPVLAGKPQSDPVATAWCAICETANGLVLFVDFCDLHHAYRPGKLDRDPAHPNFALNAANAEEGNAIVTEVLEYVATVAAAIGAQGCLLGAQHFDRMEDFKAFLGRKYDYVKPGRSGSSVGETSLHPRGTESPSTPTTSLMSTAAGSRSSSDAGHLGRGAVRKTALKGAAVLAGCHGCCVATRSLPLGLLGGSARGLGLLVGRADRSRLACHRARGDRRALALDGRVDDDALPTIEGRLGAHAVPLRDLGDAAAVAPGDARHRVLVAGADHRAPHQRPIGCERDDGVVGDAFADTSLT